MQNKFLDDSEKQVPYISIEKKPLVSLCVLSFNRSEFLHRTIASLMECTTYPAEIIIIDDGSMEKGNVEFLMKLYEAKQLSLLILNPGKNQGVGASFNKCAHCGHGKYLVKLDSDLEFTPFWLEKTVTIMETFPEIGVLGLFHYWYDPCDWRKMGIREEERDGLTIEVVKDFVGSALVFPRAIYEKFGDLLEGGQAFGEDYIKKMEIQKAGYWLALPTEDLVDNFGFGIPYTSLLYKGKEVGVSKKPLIFGCR